MMKSLGIILIIVILFLNLEFFDNTYQVNIYNKWNLYIILFSLIPFLLIIALRFIYLIIRNVSFEWKQEASVLGFGIVTLFMINIPQKISTFYLIQNIGKDIHYIAEVSKIDHYKCGKAKMSDCYNVYITSEKFKTEIVKGNSIHNRLSAGHKILVTKRDSEFGNYIKIRDISIINNQN